MRRERISENIHSFISDEYAEVTASVILADGDTILVDTLPFPHETRQIRQFLAEAGRDGVTYVVNTHHHSDHVYGNWLFPEATVISHRDCRRALERDGADGLTRARLTTPALAEVRLRLPDVTFSEEMALHCADMTLELLCLPGHTPDSCGVYVVEERILLAGDTVTTVPLVAWGDVDDLVASLRSLKELPIDAIVQGHGEVILRGEVQTKLDAGIRYLEDISQSVRQKVQQGSPEEDLEDIGLGSYVEEPMIVLQGLGCELHRMNLLKLYRSLKAEATQT
jgi:glyoxylase-like metal-dependent hydrolase (beta-lactamase superfamily II)